jgi:hypothetical protein
MTTFSLNSQEYTNFIQVCRTFHINFTTSFTKSKILITAKTDDLVKIGF